MSADNSSGSGPVAPLNDAKLTGLIARPLKRTLDMFQPNAAKPIPAMPDARRRRLAAKMLEYSAVVETEENPAEEGTEDGAGGADSGAAATTSGAGAGAGAGGGTAPSARTAAPTSIAGAIQQIQDESKKHAPVVSTSLVAYKAAAQLGADKANQSRAIVARRKPMKVPKPKWHAPWKLMRVISGHVGWPRSVTVEPGNQWFATGAGDRTIKIWDLASGTLKLTLTGHISAVRGLAVSPRHPYLFSAAEDKMVKCWDLEYNKVIRHYHGHLSGVYALALHPTIDVLVTAGRDSVARVWDIRTKQAVHVLGGHQSTVGAVLTNPVDPQVITGSMDHTIRLWDLAAGKTLSTLTHHKKSIRAMVSHPRQFTFASGGSDKIKKWQLPKGKFLQNLEGHNSIVNCMALNGDDVLVSGGDSGTLNFWDYHTGHRFFQTETKVQPGSLDCEAGFFAMCFDQTGSRLITAEADKTIKVWKEDPDATPETHPIDMEEWTREVRRHKRY